MRLNLSALALLTLSPLAAYAEDAAAPAPATPAAPVIKWEGLVDSYYLYNFKGDPSIQGPSLRAFDTNAHSFTLALAKLAAQADTDTFGLRIDFGYGATGTIYNATPFTNAAPGAFMLEQAYATAKLSPMITLDAGRFVTSAGAEVVEANKNWLYSRSLLFAGIPVLHTGLRLTAKPSDKLALMASLVNSMNTLSGDPENNAWKTIGLSAAVTPNADTLVALTSYIGKEGPRTAVGDLNVVVDLVANLNLSPTLGLNFNFDYFKNGEANWLGAALMGRFIASDSLHIAARGEFLKTKGGAYYSLADQNIFEGTLMAGIHLGANYELRLELRGDFTGEDYFVNGTEVGKNQFTGTAAFLAYF